MGILSLAGSRLSRQVTHRGGSGVRAHRLMARVWAEGKCIAGHVGVWFLQISGCVTLLGMMRRGGC